MKEDEETQTEERGWRDRQRKEDDATKIEGDKGWGQGGKRVVRQAEEESGW